ncbi:MAG: ABC transporter ATP-binding protein [Myxococcota bacterium]
MSEATAPQQPCILEIEGLHKRYGKFTAVRQIDLTVPYGQVFGLLGPNGAGKTTTLRMLTGLIQPTRGRITIDGYSLHEAPTKAKSITGFIPDRPYVYDKLTAFEYMKFIAGLYAMNKREVAKRIRALLAQFGLMEWGDSLIESFSHGMKQRLVFAGALLPEPKLLIVDEPMVGLDPKGHRLIKDLFVELTRTHGMTILLSTHTLEVAEEVCDQIAIVHHGRIIARGTMSELRTEVGEDAADLEEVFLRLTEEREEERAVLVAERFGRSSEAAFTRQAEDTDGGAL